MSFIRPNLETIIERVKGDLKEELSITAILRRSFLSAIAKAIAGVAHLLHGHMVFISKQIFPDQAELEYLEQWASIYGVERLSATFTNMSIDLVFTGAAVIPAGTTFKRSDGEIYSLDNEVNALSAGNISASVTAENYGSATNTDNGEIISLESPLANLDTDSIITATNVEGEDSETDESLRLRVVARIQAPPSGGTASDYINEMLAIAGVTRAWVLPGGLGEGTVLCYFTQDNDLDIIPDTAEIAVVQLAIDEFKPVTAEATVVAPVAKTLDLDIAISPNTQAVRDAVTGEIQDLIFRDSQVAGTYEGVGSTFDGIILLSKIDEAISIAAGEDDHNILSPTVDVTPALGELVILGTINFSTLV